MIIERDIHRTFPGHFKFEDENDQKTLGRILKAYSLMDPEVQYCQVYFIGKSFRGKSC